MEYKITISNQADPAERTPKTPKLTPEEKEDLAQKAVIYKTAEYVATRTMQFVSSHIETYTGDSSTQQAVNSISKIIGYATAIAVNPALGIAALAVDLTTTAIDRAYTNKWERIQQNNTNNILGGYSYGRGR